MGSYWGGNAARLWLFGIRARAALDLCDRQKPGHQRRRLRSMMEDGGRNAKSWKSQLTPSRAGDYIAGHQRGRCAAGAKKFALMVRNQESRVSVTRPGRSQKQIGPR